MANEQKKQTGSTDPSKRPNQPGQNPSGGSSGYQPGQKNPGGRRSEWSDKDRERTKKTPSDPSREGGMGDDSDLDLDTDESENPA